jgi:hypothetical protein
MHNVACENILDPQALSFNYKATQQKTRVFYREICNGKTGPPFHTSVTIAGASFNPEMMVANGDASFKQFSGLEDISVTLSTCGKNIPTALYRIIPNIVSSNKQSSPALMYNETLIENEDGSKSRVFSYDLTKERLYSSGRMGVMISATFNVSFTDLSEPQSTQTSIDKSGKFPYATAKSTFSLTSRSSTTSKVIVKGHITLMFSDSDMPLISFWLNQDVTIKSTLEDATGDVEYVARPLISARNGLVEHVNLHQLRKEGFVPLFDDTLGNIDI